MKKLSLILSMIAFSSFSHAQFNIDITSSAGGSFDNAISANWSPPAEGPSANDSFADKDLFQTLFISGIGNVDIYKTGTANGSWNDSSNAHTFTINVVGTPTAHGANAGPRWRIIKSVANGSMFNGNWSDISEGTNSISMTWWCIFQSSWLDSKLLEWLTSIALAIITAQALTVYQSLLFQNHQHMLCSQVLQHSCSSLSNAANKNQVN